MTSQTDQIQSLNVTLGRERELRCRICGHSEGHTEYQCSERLFGYGGSFLYFQCVHCGCLQIATVPADLSPYIKHQHHR